MTKTPRHLTACALAIAASFARGGAAADSAAVAIVGARVFDGERVLPSATVLVLDGRIAAVGPEVAVPAGVPTVDGRGKPLLPGLIDAHTHAWGDALERALVFGVTTELDMFTAVQQVASWHQEQAAGKADGRADIYSAGTLVTAPGGHGTEYGMPIPTISKPEEAQAFIDARIAEGSDYIKIVLDDGSSYGLSFPTLDRATLEAVIAAAHLRKKLAVVHIGSQADGRVALEAGADGLVHLFAGDPPEATFAQLARDRKAFAIPTLSVLESTTGVASGASLVDDADLGPYLQPAEVINLKAAFPKRAASRQDLANANAAVRALRALGVPLLAGTDAPNRGTTHGASIHRELELLVAAGLTPVEALTAATSTPARVFGLADRGRIAPGMRADLLLVAGDPTTNILATRQIAAIWKAGRPVTRKPAEAAPVAAEPRGLDASGAISDFDGGGSGSHTAQTPQTPPTPEITARFGHGWELTTDAITGGVSTASMRRVPSGAQGSAGALEVVGTVVKKAAYPWAGVMFYPGAQPMSPANLSRFRELVFWARGDGGTYDVLLFATRLGFVPARKNFVAGDEWREYTFALTDFSGLDGSDLLGIAFTAGPASEAFSFEIDQVTLR